MTARLIAIDGPLKGTTAPVPEDGELTIGRQTSNLLYIDDASISRHHCVVRAVEGAYSVIDLKSRNGTYVNGTAVSETALSNRDQIRVGNCVFAFTISGPEDDSASVHLKAEDTVFLQPGKLMAALSEERMAEDLRSLLEASRAIHGQCRLADIRARVESILTSRYPDARPPSLIAGDSDCEERWAVTAARVRNERCAIVSDKVLAVPLLAAEHVSGVIVIERTSGFEARDVELLTAIAAITAAGVETAHLLESLERENARLAEEIQAGNKLIGNSSRMRDVYTLIGRAAPTGTTILIRGESGTGKELVARALHSGSPRARFPFVAINCATLSEALLESELFGHERGAFTGAVAQKKGKIELAEGGTLFLDEIGEMAPTLQARLLRVLQEREFERVGGIRTLSCDLRLIAATNRNLEQAVREGSFREDLYYRLRVIEIVTPPLRDRREDIALLASWFARRFSEKIGRNVSGLSPDAIACLAAYSWPGNVRELENTIERAVVLGTSDHIVPEDLPDSVLESSPADAIRSGGYHSAVRESKRRILASAIAQAAGSHVEAAKLLDLNPTYLSRLLRNLETNE
jgi:transcriptional regulator with GAF, ATPase, and Fis domain